MWGGVGGTVTCVQYSSPTMAHTTLKVHFSVTNASGGAFHGSRVCTEENNSVVGLTRERCTTVEARQLQDSGGLKPKVSGFLV